MFSTLNLTSVAFTYPFGAISSLKIYSLLAVKPSILCVLSVDVHESIISPFSSNTVNLAPSNSFSPVISVLENSTKVVSLNISFSST